MSWPIPPETCRGCVWKSWCDYSHQHTEVWLEIHALFGKLTMAAFNLCSDNRGTPTRWDYFGQRSSRFPTFNQAWKTSTSCLGKHRFQSCKNQPFDCSNQCIRSNCTPKIYMKKYMTIWNDHLRNPQKKIEAQVSWLKSSHLRECYLLEMPILNDHAAETLDFLIFLVVHSSESSVSLKPASRKRFWSALEVESMKKKTWRIKTPSVRLNMAYDICLVFVSYNIHNHFAFKQQCQYCRCIHC